MDISLNQNLIPLVLRWCFIREKWSRVTSIDFTSILSSLSNHQMEFRSDLPLTQKFLPHWLRASDLRQ